ncbi:MAG: twitching motility protein, partial [Verrucomicrobia bacterium]|nr:twitching motility protein [Verrucomicrobiota bacterium]
MAVLETIHGLLHLAIDNGASDIHIKSDKPAFLRLSGHLEAVEMEPVSPEDIYEFIEQSVPKQFSADWSRDRQIDYSYRVENIGRFRVNCFLQRGLPTVVMRYVSDHPPTFDELNLDGGVLSELCKEKDGIILLCGATGTGKSSTLAAMVHHINNNYDKHIVTLEDPIEFTH